MYHYPAPLVLRIGVGGDGCKFKVNVNCAHVQSTWLGGGGLVPLLVEHP